MDVLISQVPFDEPNVWVLCHWAISDGSVVAEGTPEFAEPDIRQLGIMGDSIGLGLAASTSVVWDNYNNHVRRFGCVIRLEYGSSLRFPRTAHH
jgi:hypothetical protein